MKESYKGSSNSTKRLVIRADANAQIGTGHLMRCLALGQAWKDSGGEEVFITACDNKGLLERLYEEGFRVHLLDKAYPDPHDWEVTKEVLHDNPGAWVALDGYHFDSTYQRQIKEAGHPLLVIDDMAHLEHYYADIVLNQNLHAEQLHYSCEPYTRLLLGTRYVLLRREFLKWQGWKREIPKVARKVLVTLGGADPDNVTLKVIQALQQVDVDGLETVVVVGASNPHHEELQAAVSDSRIPIQLERNVTNMPKLMAWADLAVSSASTTVWELMFMGVPTLILILAENQRLVAGWLNAREVAENLGWHEDISPYKMAQAMTQLLREARTRAGMSERDREIVDGEGTARVVMHLRGSKIRLRQARKDDCRLFWEWANDPEVRASAFSIDPIPWETHVQWFTRKLHEPGCFLFIAVDDQDTPVGQVRFEVDREDEAEIDVTVDKSKRGMGYGPLLISVGIKEVSRLAPIRTVHAFVKPYNKASMKAFEKAGFKQLGIKTVRGNMAIHYVEGNNE